MNASETIDLLTLICLVLLAWAVIATVILLEEKRKKSDETEAYGDMTPKEIPENDRKWKIRTELVERIRAEIVNCLITSGGCWINTEADGKNLLLTHGEAHALLMPFLQKGYFAYIGSNGSNICGLTRFGVVKHRLPYKNELEITEELLNTNAQL